MQITRSSIETARGSSDWFTGAVYVDSIAVPADSSRVSASVVHFTPGARTAWHRHPHGQTIWVFEGIGLCQRRGDRIEVIRPGDRVFFEPDEEHWHGAVATRFMGADRIILLGRNPERVTLGKEFGATDVVSERATRRSNAFES